jgi:hypothetical protein
MNDGVMRGTGANAKGLRIPCQWQLIEVTQTIPFLHHAKYVTFFVVGAGGGGGSGRIASGTNAGGGGVVREVALKSTIVYPLSCSICRGPIA